MKLLVGLGNPGRDYAGTRHNVGFEVVESFAARLGWATAGQFARIAKSDFSGLVLDGMYVRHRTGEMEKVLLLEPTTYMNVSGKSVGAAMAFYQLSPPEVMIVLDDLALPCGRIRIRPGGSDGAHNGLRDIQRALGTTQYPRLRIGIDPVPPPQAGKDYVLGKFTPEQRTRLDPAIARACGAIATWIDEGINVAMTQFNAEEK